LFTVAQAGSDGSEGWVSTTAAPATWSDWSSSSISTTTYTTTETSYITSYITTTTTETDYLTKYITTTTTELRPTTSTEIQTKPTTITVPTTITSVSGYTQLTTILVPTTVVSVSRSTFVSTVTSTQQLPGSTTTQTITTCSSPPPSPPTSTLSGLVTCPSRIINPTFTPSAPLPSNYLWGCPPGKICTPKQENCNFEQNPPASSFVCSPDECKPAPDIPSSLLNITTPENPPADCAWYTPIEGYFNLNPYQFGLTFAIYDIYGQPLCPADSPTTSSSPTSQWADWPASTKTPKSPRRRGRNPLAQLRARASYISAPSSCFGQYNAASVVAQQLNGQAGPLCGVPEATLTLFERLLGACDTCLNNHPGEVRDSARTYDWVQKAATLCGA